MQQIFLASSGLGALPAFLSGDAGENRDLHTLKVAFIPTAANKDANPWWITKDKQTLESLGLQLTEVDIDVVRGPALEQALAGIDAVFVAGGNSFYLLSAVQASGLEPIIYRLLAAGKQYIGSSAGAILAGPDISPASSVDDAGVAPGLLTTRALGLVKFVILPHYNIENRFAYDEIIQQYTDMYSFKTITDEQAVIVSTDGIRTTVESKQI